MFPKWIISNVFQIPFRDQYEMTVIPLFEHVLQTIWLYSSMYVRLKWFGSNTLLESVLCLMYIRAIVNVCQYVYEIYGFVLTKVTPNKSKTVRSSDEKCWNRFNDTKIFSEAFRNMNCHLSWISCDSCELELFFVL